MTKFFLPEVIVGSRRSLDDAPLTLVRVPRCTEADDQTPDRILTGKDLVSQGLSQDFKKKQ